MDDEERDYRQPDPVRFGEVRGWDDEVPSLGDSWIYFVIAGCLIALVAMALFALGAR